MAEEKDTAAPAKRTAGKTGRRKKPEAEHAARAAPQDKDTGSKAQELLEQARTEPKPEWEVAEQVVLLPLDRLRPFKNHPFKVNDEDELMQDTIDSIMAGGVINPILVRPAEDGKFEVVSGHRRFRASELAGKADIKAIVREMDDDTAVITMVDSNLQRENILPSERAFSYRMKMEALTHQGQRTDPTLRQLGAKFRTAELVGQPAGDSARQVQRFIRLTELIPQLLDMLIVQDAVWNRVTINREAHKSTRYYIDEMHLLLREEQTAAYTVEIWKRFRKWGGIPTGITQNVKDLLSSREVENIFENSDYVFMLNQASGDRQILAKQLNISPHQLSYVTHSGEGEGLLFYGSTILPFVDRFPKDTELYRIITTKPQEQAG